MLIPTLVKPSLGTGAQKAEGSSAQDFNLHTAWLLIPSECLGGERQMSKERSRDGEGERGKHRKPTPCSMCHGTGKVKISLDNKQVERGCVGCGGTGKV